jgi:hypothetical protein
VNHRQTDDFEDSVVRDYKTIVARLIIPAEEAANIARALLAGPQQEAKPTHSATLHVVN